MILLITFRICLSLFALVCNTVCQSPSLISDVENNVESLEAVADAKIVDLTLKRASPDSYLPTPDLIKRHGFPVETHTVITQDHYVLTLYRIPHGRYNANTTAQRQPVLLQHGLLSQSADWLMNTVDKALAYKLADGGYDVWLGNARGTTPSSKHISLSTKKSNYWDYSWHEMGKYDIPAVIDYILNKSGESQMFYVGHSMGTTMYFVAMSLKPEYNKKIRLMIALGPAAYVDHMKSGIRYLAPLEYFEKAFLDVLGNGKLLPQFLLKYIHKYAPEYCDPDSRAASLCDDIIFAVGGFDAAQANFSQIPIILGHSPAETSTKTVIHYLQLIRAKKFQQYDYGVIQNLRKYNRLTPPQYNFHGITSPVALFWAHNDILCTPTDVQRLATQLPNLVGNIPIRLKTFSHIDFVFAVDADKLVYNKVIEMMKEY